MLALIVILTTCTIHVIGERHHLMSVTGEVSGGNYTYYSLTYEGPISLLLYSQSGDADLYISQKLTTPTFEPETYCLQSSTCGLDVVHIPKSFQRPIGIGVYGHPSHEKSSYLLEVFLLYDEDVFNPFSEEANNDLIKLFNNDVKIHDKLHTTESRGEDEEEEEEEDSFIWALVWSFIGILLEVLFL